MIYNHIEEDEITSFNDSIEYEFDMINENQGRSANQLYDAYKLAAFGIVGAAILILVAAVYYSFTK